MEIGDKVYCFYDTEIPVVKGTIFPNEKGVSDKFQRVHWNDGGVSYFRIENIFTDYEKAKDYWREQIKKETETKEIDEYNLYLRLKEKYEK